MSEEPGRYDVGRQESAARSQDHENRSRVLADQVRWSLIGMNIGGIVLALWLEVRGAYDAYTEISCPVFIFALGLVVTVLGLQVVRYKERRRMEAARSGRSPPVFMWFLQGWFFEWIAILLFLGGIAVALALL